MNPHLLNYLVVDDLELMRAVTVNQLRGMGYEKIKVARNGAEALEMLRAFKFDAVLSDWNMPVMNGLELLKAVRADAKLAKLPFLMITAETERQRIEEVISAGVNGLAGQTIQRGQLAGPARPHAEPAGARRAPASNAVDRACNAQRVRR
jgi:two-component system sensor histidine kinase/response regulator